MKPIQYNEQGETSGAVDSADVLETLVEALSHEQATIREGAAREFARRKDKRGILPLTEVLADSNAGVRLQVATALSELGWRPSDEVQKARHIVALQQFPAVLELGEAAIDPLVMVLNDSDASLRLAALETIAAIGSKRASKAVVELLKDESPHVRAVAVQALGGLGGSESADSLIKLVRDPSWEVRAILLETLGGFQTSQCVEAVGRFVKDEVAELRLRATELLGQMGDRRAIKHLVTALVDENSGVRLSAEQNLKNLDANWEKTEYAKDAISSLLPALKNYDDAIRQKAADTLRIMGQIRAMNSYLTAETGTSSHAAVPVLAHALHSANRDLRQAVAEALGKTGDSAATAHLVEALMDEDQYVREAALYSLNLLNWKPENDDEVVLKAVILQRWETAILFDSLAFEPLCLMLTCSDPEVCKSAINALAQIGDKRAVEPLAFMLHHPHKQVRVATAHALRALGWLPKDARESIGQAIELEDWATVSQHGAAAVEPLIATIKENYETDELRNAAAQALASITDGQAVKPLLALSRDGQIAEIVISALTNIVEFNPGDVSADDLLALSALNNIFQFRYVFDVRYAKLVRSGLQEVDSAKMKKLAMQELARRGI